MRAAERFPVDPESERPCPSCGHAKAHDRGEYEDTHLHCVHFDEHHERCSDIGGKHRRWSKRCEEETGGGACWTRREHCDCTSEDRLIAELHAEIDRLIDEHSQLASPWIPVLLSIAIPMGMFVCGSCS